MGYNGPGERARIAPEATVLRTVWDWLRGRLGCAPHGVQPHPPLDADRQERRLEHVRFEEDTRHVGSTADADRPLPDPPGDVVTLEATPDTEHGRHGTSA